MNIDPETVLSALFALITNSVVVNFTGQAHSGSATITGVSSVAGLFTGLPVFGPGVPNLAVIESFDPIALTCTLDQNLTSNSDPGAAFATGFLTSSRRLRLWAETPEQPAIFLRHTDDDDTYNQTVMQKTVISAEIWIYSQAGKDPDAAPDVTLNNLAKCVRSALAMDVRGRPQTLGGLVQWARIEGRSEYDPGDLDNQSKALIPVKILCP